MAARRKGTRRGIAAAAATTHLIAPQLHGPLLAMQAALRYEELVQAVWCLLQAVASSHRTAQEGDFSAQELAALEALHPHIDQARRRVNAVAVETAARRGLEMQLGHLSLPTVILDWELRTIYHNRAAREPCAQWGR